jgi:hypothetical protein
MQVIEGFKRTALDSTTMTAAIDELIAYLASNEAISTVVPRVELAIHFYSPIRIDVHITPNPYFILRRQLTDEPQGSNAQGTKFPQFDIKNKSLELTFHYEEQNRPTSLELISICSILGLQRKEATAMGTLRFADLQPRPTEVLDLTSLTVDEFRQLGPPFEAGFQAQMADWRLDGKPRTARRYTTYQNCPLPTPEDRLLCILTYLKTSPLQVVQGRLFGMGQSKAHERNRFESSHATRLNRAVGLYFGLLA